MNRLSSLDAKVITVTLLTVIIYLFISWGPYPRFWNILFFGVPACGVQFLFYRIMRPKFLKILPLILSAAFACWEFFVFRNPICIAFQLPALCCIGTYLYLKKGAKHELL